MHPEPTAEPGKPRTPGVVLCVAAIIVLCVAGIVVAALALYLPVRSEISLVDPGSSDGRPAIETTSAAESTMTADGIESESAAVVTAVLASSQAWSQPITGVELATLLRRPVIVVSTSIGPEQADLSDSLVSDLASFASGLTAPDGSHYTYYMQIRSADGEVVGTVGSTDARWALQAPPSPADAGALSAWLDTVYGTGAPVPEKWLDRITSIAQSGGSLVVRTDLDPSAAADARTAQTIIDAVDSSGATFVSSIRVVFADGIFEWSSVLTGTDPLLR